MEGGCLSNGATSTSTVLGDANGDAIVSTSMIIQQLSTLSVNATDIPTVQPRKMEKDPRKIAREYQTELCKKALEENVVVYLETGCGKTHIAILLIYEMGHLIKKPQKNICIFLAPTVALVQQQAKVIEDSVDFKVGTYCGSSKRLKNHHDWEKEMEEYEVFVMTPQILLHNLSHCFIRMELIALLIFDECHHAQIESNHPYAEIMKVFYKADVVKLPRIFGMTASPKLGKGASVDGLETLLRAKVYSVECKDELAKFVSSPKVNIYYYDPTVNGSSGHLIYCRKLEEIKRQCMLALPGKTGDHNILRSTKKMLQKLHGNIMVCVENLGLWGALQACRILLKGDFYELNELTDADGTCADDSLCNRYLTQLELILTNICIKDGTEPDLSNVEDLTEPFFSRKLLCLIGILRNFRLQPNMKCIIFVNRIMTARSLSYILRNLRFLGFWKCDFLLGVHSGLKSMSRKNTNVILGKFRSGEVNLLIATKVGEEGLDIQTCCLVIRFDLPETVTSFIQSRGRARMPQSEYAFVVNRGNEKELNLIKHFIKEETQMNEEVLSRKSQMTTIDFDVVVYKVDLTGATISSGSSVSLIYHYCSKLPHDEFFSPIPQFFYFDDSDGIVCKIILPSNAPIHQIVSTAQASSDAAKRDACLKACRSLHEIGALTDYLLPEQDDADDELDDDSLFEINNDELSRRELHEMLVPSALKQQWTELESPVTLSCYYFKFSPNPVDRVYKEFSLFVKAPLPKEAEKMSLELHLDRGRSVLTELIPCGVSYFEKDELVQAEMFQRMFFKVILDRSDFIPEIVSLEDSDNSNLCSSTFYLMLPVLFTEDNKISVDWNLITRCLSSPIFGAPVHPENGGISHGRLHLANGVRSSEEVTNSLVYVPCKDTFFFISEVVTQKNGYSAMMDKDSKNHVEHYDERFSIRLSYPDQPLLKAKQLFCLDNLLRKQGHPDIREKVEHFIELPPEICQLKIIGFSKDIGSSLSLLPSFMHRLESLLVAIELRDKLSESFPEGAEVTVQCVLEALMTEKCNEHFSLERLEVLGDAFLKFAVGRHVFLLHDKLDEGQLTTKRSNIVKNSNLLNLVIRKNLQVYIRDQSFEPCQFFPLGRPCHVICTKETEREIHSPQKNTENSEVRCNKCHHWLHKKTIADVFEALVGAFIVDSGFKAATAFLKWMGIQIDFKDSQVSKICSASTIFLPLANQLNINALETSLGYHFVHKGLLIQAFLHPSFSNQSGGCYQRLEFLGDAVLDYLITCYLYSVYPKLKPGHLTDLRSAFVNNKSLADVAINRSFQKFIISDSGALSKSMDKYASFIQKSDTENGCLQEPTCPKPLGDVVESCIGAILLDTGFDLNYLWKIMLSLLKPVMNSIKLQINPIRDFQELCQSHNLYIEVSSSKQGGKFTVVIKVISDSISADASATNVRRRAAERMAAHQLVSYLKERGYRSKSKPLEEILKESEKLEAHLIGYDETPCVVTPEVPDLQLQEDSKSDFDFKVRSLNEMPQRSSITEHKDVRRDFLLGASGLKPRELQPLEIVNNGDLNSDVQETGDLHKKLAKVRLREICASNYWKPPTFECCEVTGPSHLPEFTFKVVVEIEDASHKMLECYGEPRTTKKAAAEHAAEGALWYLKHEGY